MNERQPFPPWLRELCYFIGLGVLISTFLFTMKSDQRSTSEVVERLAQDFRSFSERLSKIEERLPNKEADGLRLKAIEDKQKEDRAELDFEIAKINKWIGDTTRDLIKKGVID